MQANKRERHQQLQDCKHKHHLQSHASKTHILSENTSTFWHLTLSSANIMHLQTMTLTWKQPQRQTQHPCGWSVFHFHLLTACLCIFCFCNYIFYLKRIYLYNSLLYKFFKRSFSRVFCVHKLEKENGPSWHKNMKKKHVQFPVVAAVLLIFNLSGNYWDNNFSPRWGHFTFC